MKTISVEALQPGMVLASHLETSTGRFLLAEGTPLTDKHLRVMKIWGIVEAEVVDGGQVSAAPSSDAELDPELLARSEAFNNRLFSLCDLRHEAVAELHRLCIRRTAQLLAAGWSPPEPPVPDSLHPLEPEKDFGTPQSVARSEDNLLSFSNVYEQIVQVLNNPLSSTMHLADVVSKDPALSAKLLRLVNSPFYGYPSKIDSILRAITLVGSNELTTLAIGVSVLHRLQDMPPEVMDMETFWKHSICCGVLARLLASHRTGLPEETCFVAGLLHDVGQFILAKRFPKAMTMVFHECKALDLPIHTAERKRLGYDHGAVAGALFTAWRFPETLADATHHHHEPRRDKHFIETCVVHLADFMALALRIDIRSAPVPLPPLMPDAWTELGLSPSVLSAVVSQADRQVRHIYRVFLG